MKSEKVGEIRLKAEDGGQMAEDYQKNFHIVGKRKAYPLEA